VVVSAYACGPSDESEAGAGWAFAAAAARDHEVWLITQPRFREEITAALEKDPDLADHLRPVYVALSGLALRLKKRPRDVFWYYPLWQRRAGQIARSLHERVRFDVAHHVTFAVDWQLCGLNSLRDVPLVWGPVGGASYLPWRLARWIGWRGVLGEIGRNVVTRSARRLFGDPVARRAAVVVAQNAEVAKRFHYARRVVVEPNASLDPPAATRRGRGGAAKQAILVGRLIPWKGVRLAISALAEPSCSDWTLAIYGSGKQRASLETLAEDLGISDRVSFLGQRPRAEVLAAYAEADAMIFPSMHDSAGWAVGEASAVGCPVVCLDVGGPPLLAGPNGHVVATRGPIVANLARALVQAGAQPGEPYPRWEITRLPELVGDWYADAASSTSAADLR
jgi:glycosyltransferase involved in cell wall biosynthesis